MRCRSDCRSGDRRAGDADPGDRTCRGAEPSPSDVHAAVEEDEHERHRHDALVDLARGRSELGKEQRDDGRDDQEQGGRGDSQPGGEPARERRGDQHSGHNEKHDREKELVGHDTLRAGQQCDRRPDFPALRNTKSSARRSDRLDSEPCDVQRSVGIARAVGRARATPLSRPRPQPIAIRLSEADLL